MLAVNIDQLFTQMAQLCGRCGRAIDPCTAAALAVYDPAQQQLRLLRKARFFKPGLQMRRAVKFGADIGLTTALAHDLSVRTGAQHQLQGIQHDGFARAGFAGQHGETRLPVQIK